MFFIKCLIVTQFYEINLITIKRNNKRTMNYIFFCAYFDECIFKLIHDAVVFEFLLCSTILNASHWFTVFHLRSVLHLMNGFGTGINYFCRLMWPVAVTAACNLYTCTCKSKQYNIHFCCVNYYKFKVFLRLQIWILDNPKNIISTYFLRFL